jgi:6-phosphogluconolactonase
MGAMRWWKVVLGAGALALSGCNGFFVPNNSTTGGTGGTGAAGDFLYVANNGTGTGVVTGFTVSSTGTLSAIANLSLNLGAPISAMAITPSDAYIYASSAGGIYLLGIDGANGQLTVGNNGTALYQDVSPTYMTVDPTGNFLLAAGISTSTAGPAIGIYQIQAGGVLAELTGSPIAIPLPAADQANASNIIPVQLAIAPNSSFVYVTLGETGVEAIPFSTSGGLNPNAAQVVFTPGGTSGILNNDYAIDVDPSGRFLYVSETNAGLRVFTIGSNGRLTQNPGSPYAIGSKPVFLKQDSTGGYLYAANSSSVSTGSISGFSISNGGGLTQISGSPYATGISPSWMTLDQSKKYLAVVNSGGSPDLQIYSFDASTAGKLDAGSSATTGTTSPSGATIVVSTQ